MTITSLQHVALPFPGTTEAFAAARSYYSGTLGLRELPVPRDLVADVVWYEVGSQELHLFAERDPTSSAESRSHACLEVTDLGSMRARLHAEGMNTFDGVPVLPGRVRFFTRDPFGNVLEFVTMSRAT
jgi:catechol 2,3-dioxygenase-like lactoylglutathione lyase family enzyme